MTRTISPKGSTLLADMPGLYGNDPYSLAATDTLGRELQRIEDLLMAIQAQLFPKNADDTYGILGFWEELYGLPIEPANVPLDIRQNRVVSASRQRRSGSGKDWVARVSDVIGTNGWSYDEQDPAPYNISILLPYAPTSVTATTGSETLGGADHDIAVTSASTFTASGTIRVGDQFVTYTSVSSNTFHGCTGGTGTWPGGTQVTQGTQYTTGQAQQLLRAITPAHIALQFGYTVGFLVDMSLVDEDIL